MTILDTSAVLQGIPTSRAATVVVSDDPVVRDQFYNGFPKTEKAAVVLRLAPSWFRFGSLEILAHNKELTSLKKLLDFILTVSPIIMPYTFFFHCCTVHVDSITILLFQPMHNLHTLKKH